MRDATADYDFLILPGLGNSGVDHWQSYWCLAFRNATRVLQDEWDAPVLSDWLTRLDAAIAGGTRPAVLICHSLSCSLAAHWAARNDKGRVVAAFLVAPADVEPGAYARQRTQLRADPARAVSRCRRLVVASTDDPYVTLRRARRLRARAGAAISAMPANLATSIRTRGSAFWPQGLLMLGQLLARVKT